MITVTKQKKGYYTISSDNYIFLCHYDDNKVWLTKKEISKIYGIKKKETKQLLNEILISSSLDIESSIKKTYNNDLEKQEKLYCLDVLILLGYKTHSYGETKFLIKINRILKNKNKKSQGILELFSQGVKILKELTTQKKSLFIK